MANIGFVGLGHMGMPMALQLVKAGHNVTGFDVQENVIAAFCGQGGHGAKNLQAASQEQDVFITMLQSGDQVKQVCIGAAGLFAHATLGALFIDCSSIDVISARLIHNEAAKYHLNVVDSPVSGGVAGAAAATLTFMVGGSDLAYSKAEPYLNCMGKRIVHTGDAGSGQAAKICNNLILGISMIAISEAFTLAEHLGLSAEKLYEVVSHSSGQCWAMTNYIPVPGILPNVPASHDYKPGFTSSMMLKDLKLSQQSAESMGITTPLAHHATSLYQQFKDKGMGELDFSAIIKLIQSND